MEKCPFLNPENSDFHQYLLRGLYNIWHPSSYVVHLILLGKQRESIGPHHVSREDAYWPVGLDPDGYVSFLARGQNVSMFIYDLKEEEDWMDGPLRRSYSNSGVTAEMSRGDHFVLNRNQKSRGAKRFRLRFLVHLPGCVPDEPLSILDQRNLGRCRWLEELRRKRLLSLRDSSLVNLETENQILFSHLAHFEFSYEALCLDAGLRKTEMLMVNEIEY